MINQVMMSLFNPRGDGTLRPGDLMYDLVTGRDLVIATHNGVGWVETAHKEIDGRVGTTG